MGRNKSELDDLLSTYNLEMQPVDHIIFVSLM